MASLNKVMLLGNLGKDPEIKATQKGNEFANLTLATSESWTDKQSGEKKERTEWHKIVVWNEGLVKVLKQFCHKGDKLYVEGQLKTRKWTDNNNQDKYTTEVVLGKFTGNLVMCNPKTSNSKSGVQVHDIDYPTKAEARLSRAEKELDDEIPF
jgi:single-strand DNA-binding protein